MPPGTSEHKLDKESQEDPDPSLVQKHRLPGWNGVLILRPRNVP